MSELIYKSAPEVIRAAAALTGSLVASSEVDVSADSYVDVDVDYTKGGSATLLELVPEVQIQGDTTWRGISAQNAGSVSAGAVSVELVTLTYTVTATGVRRFSVPVFGASKFRVKARETGTPGGSATITATRSRVGA